MALQIALGVWGGGLLLFATVWVGGELAAFIKRQKYSGVEWYRWRHQR